MGEFMKEKKDYVKYLREKVGHEQIILNYAGCIIENEKGQLLLQKRSDCNEWGFFGGIMELGESADEAARREVMEESGFDVDIHELLGIYTKYFTTYSNGDAVQTVVHVFIASVKGKVGEIDSLETVEMRWFDKNDIPVLFNEQHRDGLADYLTGKRGFYR